MKKLVNLGPVRVGSYLINKGDLFFVEEDSNCKGESYLIYLGKIPKKLLKKIEAL